MLREFTDARFDKHKRNQLNKRLVYNLQLRKQFI